MCPHGSWQFTSSQVCGHAAVFVFLHVRSAYQHLASTRRKSHTKKQHCQVDTLSGSTLVRAIWRGHHTSKIVASMLVHLNSMKLVFVGGRDITDPL